MSELREEMLQQAEEIILDNNKEFAEFIKTGNSNTAEELAAVEHAGLLHAKWFAAVNPGASVEEVARAKLSWQKDLLEGGDLGELVAQMKTDRANPEAMEKRLQAEIASELARQRTMSAVFDKSPQEQLLDSIVNEVSGQKPTEIQRQAAEYFANQYVVVEKKLHPGMSEEQIKEMVFMKTKDFMENGNLVEMVKDMTADLKDPNGVANRQAAIEKEETKVAEIASIWGNGRTD